ncbi:MAG: N-acetylmuramoyl-L-alanine amidase [Flavobacteriales bacterium]|nr:N-acetylmuramoyl-L-alanine amidase [Flavobacteriales bacterium]MDG1766659.1 N-acetylmuramoyl-L-alanine amidase [Flavobacteriales bacterium]
MNKRLVILFLACTVALFWAFTPKSSNKGRLQRVVIDAGHGGKDPGNLGTGRFKTTEKDITLEVSKLVGNYISEAYPEVEIIYTRTGDSYPSLNDRVEIANESQADLFISIHCDAFTKPSAKGSGTFVMGMHKSEESLRVAMKENASIYMEDDYESKYGGFDPKDPDTYIALTLRQNAYLDQSLNLSKRIQDQFRERVGRVDRGVRQAGYYVICFTTMPSVLVELGFLTNAEEEDFLNSEKGKTYMASAIFRAFRDYKNELEGIEAVVLDEQEKIIDEVKVQDPPLVDQEDKHQPEKEKPEENKTSDSNWRASIVQEHIRKGVKFQVQILTSSNAIETTSSEFIGLTDVDEYISNGLYKYAVGSTSNYKKAQEMQKTLRDNGFPGAFVIAFKNGERVGLNEALRDAP